MKRSLVILRPQPGADHTSSRARDLGIMVLVCPLFMIKPLRWEPPDPGAFDALMLTSANAARQSGPDLSLYAGLPLWCVGNATAKACREAGLSPVHIGNTDSNAMLRAMHVQGFRRVLHLCGRNIRPVTVPAGVHITRMAVYASEENDIDLTSRLESGMVILVHSPRAGMLLDRQIPVDARKELRLIAISEQAKAASGTGWSAVHIAEQPNDAAMLVIAAQLCHE